MICPMCAIFRGDREGEKGEERRGGGVIIIIFFNTTRIVPLAGFRGQGRGFSSGLYFHKRLQ